MSGQSRLPACRWLLTGVSIFLSACTTVGPDYQVPGNAKVNATSAQHAFQEAPASTSTKGELPDDWWKLYDDPQLNTLIAQALQNNTKLRIAAANLARSEALAMEADGAREIKAGAAVGIERAQVSGESFLLTHTVPIFNLGNAGIRAGYQVDLVGGLKRAVEAADADVEASRAAQDVARISVVAETALAYMETCAAGEELAVVRQDLALQEKQQQATARLIASGRNMAVDLPRTQQRLEQLRATLPAYAARQRLALYRLAILTGQTPGDYPHDLAQCAHLPQLKQAIPVGDGAALLRRRPDIHQAERSLAAATARIGVATAALYPSISLGLSGGATGILDHLGQAQTRRWSLGPLISWTLPGDEEKARVHQANAQAAGALAHFDTVVLQALQEVESALSVLAKDMDREAALQQGREAAGEAQRQVQAMFRAGRLSYLDVLEAQRNLTSSQIAVTAAHSQVALDQVKLFLALGGGWQNASEQP